MANNVNFASSFLPNHDDTTVVSSGNEFSSKSSAALRNKGVSSHSITQGHHYDSADAVTTTNNHNPSLVGDNQASSASLHGFTIHSISPKDTKEYTLKFSFNNEQDQSTSGIVASKHVAVLHAIITAFPTTVLFDNYGHKVVDPSSITKKAAYNRRFNLHNYAINSRKRRGNMSYVVHRLHSSVTIPTICHNSVVSKLLKRHHVRISQHLWTEDDTEIVNLGFHIGADPCNQLKDQFEDQVRHQISESTGITLAKLPRFQCGYITPFFNSKSGRVKTRSYDIQCRKSNAAELIPLLRMTFTHDLINPPSFVFHKLRHMNSEAYKNAILSQKSFLQNSRVVPIQGVSESMMMYLIDDLMQLDGVQGIQYHKDTFTKGRWSIMTTKEEFRTLSTLIAATLPDLALMYEDEDELDPSFPPIGLAFKHTKKIPSSIPISHHETSYDMKSVGTGPTVATDSSHLTPDNFAHALLENHERLQTQVSELSNKLHSLQQQHNKLSDIPKEIDLSQIIHSTAQAVLRSMHSLPQPTGD
uniref:Uncharacterized protein n=1 Tax=Entomoneis paludosa TaxID=265537 RepID=A0A7S2YIT3_9STRA|mmetsp:Transcript_34335/g.71492  ORF Transcript_34335/g.71492 Transcript_34335/m.71492 type:complete len:529 (+) Transcript_34335:1864-3450(+)|eukprot:CAMPEP_0172444302 /NCGR_PEP_ID=MMETSP1065-20121228/4361_1 /TAXON_ID=265537 /ORGANISM="Amphiprora paludosa, Strain CCMP125" /LENGTH=528 /DNA_ID=CAMNT_0013194779 /DNA_START=136 /DNA_END=1722 /DNA_ORIENTATION=-